MNLTETPDFVTWPQTVDGYVEKVGPFQQTAMAAWQELQQAVPKIADQKKITHRYFARYKPEASVYRAAVGLSEPISQLPPPLKCETFGGGRFARFILVGPYANLGPATGRVFELVEKLGLKRRDDFCIENSVNDPKVTPESELRTEILIPVE